MKNKETEKKRMVKRVKEEKQGKRNKEMETKNKSNIERGDREDNK